MKKKITLWCLLASAGACGFALARRLAASLAHKHVDAKYSEHALSIMEGEGGIVLS